MSALTPVRFLYGNIVDPNATFSSSGVTSSSFAADYIGNDFIGVRSRISNRATGYWQVTFTEAQAVTCMVIQGHNLMMSGTVALLGSNNNWSSSTTIVADTDIDSADPRAFYFASASYTSFRLYPVDASNTDNYIEMGRLFLGTWTQPDRNYSRGWDDARVGYSVKTETPNGIIHVDSRPSKRAIVLPFDRVSIADRDLVDAVIDDVGDHSPFYVVPDFDGYPNRCRRVMFDQLPRTPNVTHGRHSFQLQMIEAL